MATGIDKKDEQKITSKYIKNHTISNGESHNFFDRKKTTDDNRIVKPSVAVQPTSKYIKNTKSESRWFNVDLRNPLICYAVGSGSFGVYVIASSGFGLSSGFDILNILFAFLLPVILYLGRRDVYFSKNMRHVYVAMGIFVAALVISYTKNIAYIDMMWLLLLATVPLTASYIGYNEETLKWIAYTNVAISLILVVDYSIGGITAGWNPNSVGLYSLYGISWIVFTGKERKREHIIIDTVVFSVSFVQMAATDCRSAMGGLVALVALHYFVPLKLLLNKTIYRIMYAVIMVFPIFAVEGMLWLYRSEFAHELDKWIMEKTDKSLFSGREEIWDSIYRNYISDFVFGNGEAVAGNPHSVYMALLMAVGFVGLIAFIWLFFQIFEFMHRRISDHIVRASFTAFLAVYIPHAFEPTIVFSYPLNITYFMILAVGVGRVCILDKKERDEQTSQEDDDV